MLALTLDVGESILIGDNCYITYARRKGRHIVLSINAPREIPIKRLNQDGTVLTRLGTHAASVPDIGADGSGGVLGESAASKSPPLSLQRVLAERKSVDNSNGLNG